MFQQIVENFDYFIFRKKYYFWVSKYDL